MKFLIILLNPCSLGTLPWSGPLFWPSSTALLFGLKADSDGCLSELTGCCSPNSPGDTRVCSLLKNIESLGWKWCGQLRVLQVLADSSILTRLIVIMRNEGRVAGLNHLSTMNRRRIRQVIRKMSIQGKPILNAIVTACFALLYLFSEPDPAAGQGLDGFWVSYVINYAAMLISRGGTGGTCSCYQSAESRVICI